MTILDDAVIARENFDGITKFLQINGIEEVASSSVGLHPDDPRDHPDAAK